MSQVSSRARRVDCRRFTTNQKGTNLSDEIVRVRNQERHSELVIGSSVVGRWDNEFMALKYAKRAAAEIGG